MKNTPVNLPVSTLEKLSQLLQLLEQASQLAREIKQKTYGLIDDSQSGYWTQQWQAMEREADDALAEGEYREFDSAEALIADLHTHV